MGSLVVAQILRRIFCFWLDNSFEIYISRINIQIIDIVVHLCIEVFICSPCCGGWPRRSFWRFPDSKKREKPSSVLSTIFDVSFFFLLHELEKFSKSIFDRQSVKLHFFSYEFELMSSKLLRKLKQSGVSLLVPHHSFWSYFFPKCIYFHLIYGEPSFHSNILIANGVRKVSRGPLNIFPTNQLLLSLLAWEIPKRAHLKFLFRTPENMLSTYFSVSMSLISVYIFSTNLLAHLVFTCNFFFSVGLSPSCLSIRNKMNSHEIEIIFCLKLKQIL